MMIYNKYGRVISRPGEVFNEAEKIMNKEHQITVGVQSRCNEGEDPTFHTFLDLPWATRRVGKAHTTQREAQHESQALMDQLARCHFDVCLGCEPAPRISNHKPQTIGRP